MLNTSSSAIFILKGEKGWTPLLYSLPTGSSRVDDVGPFLLGWVRWFWCGFNAIQPLIIKNKLKRTTVFWISKEIGSSKVIGTNISFGHYYLLPCPKSLGVWSLWVTVGQPDKNPVPHMPLFFAHSFRLCQGGISGAAHSELQHHSSETWVNITSHQSMLISSQPRI